MTEPATVDRQKMLELIDQLPQAKFIPMEDRLAWLEEVIHIDPERVEWHIRRLNGFGGSEIGALVTHVMPEYRDDFMLGTPHDVVSAKLMKQLPKRQNGHMARGTFMEDAVTRPAFRSHIPGIVPMENEMRMIARHRSKKHAWLVGNPDDLVRIGRNVILADYKSPSSDFLDDFARDGAPFGYVCQLHHYDMIAEELGIKIDQMVLVPWHVANWRFYTYPIQRVPEIRNAIRDMGDLFWNEYVMKGRIPEVELRTEVDEVISKDIAQDLLELSAYQLFSNKASKEAGEIKKRITEKLKLYKLEGKKLAGGAIEVSSNKALNLDLLVDIASKYGLKPEDFTGQGEFDANLLVNKVRELGGDPEECRAPGGLDEHALLTAVVDQGEPEERFHSEKLRISLVPSTRKSEELDAIRATADNAVINAYKSMTATGKKTRLAPVQP